MNLTYHDLYTDEGLNRIHHAFTTTNPPEDLLEKAIALQGFIEQLFNGVYHDEASDQILIQKVRRDFVQRYALARFGDTKLDAPAPDNHPVGSILTWAKDVWARFQIGDKLEQEARYAVWAAHQAHPHPLFTKPQNRVWEVELPAPIGKRVDFSLADPGLSSDEAYKEAFYCIGCHKKEKDSCSKGMEGENPLGVKRQGCPLGQKISQMAVLTQQGHWLAGLAVAMIDNPLIAATGHRICTACMDACIYQKQNPVKIPGLESFLLQTLYKQPFGFEIYRLLTLWNPLAHQPLPLPASHRHAFVAGMGPAGMMIAHGLLRQGHNVRAVDGLHIRPLPNELLQSTLIAKLPDKNSPVWRKDGFGGVMSYGITARWDASHLLVLRLLFERHPRFALKGDIRLGSTTNITNIRQAGFDHIALCLGAGSPSHPPATLLKGSRFAHDFLMALHLHQKPPKVELPCVVVGGGLTAVDTATEVLVWLRQQHGPDLPRNAVTLIYRKPLGQSPAWRLNADEVREAAKEGVHIISNAVPLATECDEHGRVTGLQLRKPDGHTHTIAAKTVLLATGTNHHTLEELGLPNPKNLASQEFLIEDDVSVLGDVHPYYRGSVVEAMASSKNALSSIHQAIVSCPARDASKLSRFWDDLAIEWMPPESIGNNLWLLSVKAPELARHFQPGQFFRVSVEGYPPMALTGAWHEGDHITMLMFETLFTQPLLQALNKGEQPGIMGPTGAPTFLPQNTRMQLVGSGFGHGALLAIAHGLKQNGCHITYLGQDDGTYQNWRHRIEKYADKCVWFHEEWPMLEQNIYTLIIGPPVFLQSLSKMTVPKGALACSVTSMQCMMKGMCGRCIKQVGPDSYVWACAEQDQLFGID